jgi:hypothetical protein
VPGVRGTGLHFDGTGNYAETAKPILDTTKSYTVSAWVTLDRLPGNYATVVSQDGQQRENPFYLQYGQGGFTMSMPGGQRARVQMTPELGRWYHLTGVRDAAASTLSLYLDGEPVATITTGSGLASGGPLTVGRALYAGDRTDYWNGSIDEVHAVNVALSAAQVKALYTAERP